MISVSLQSVKNIKIFTEKDLLTSVFSVDLKSFLVYSVSEESAGFVEF
jgi:hypothetical protein